MQDPNNEKLNIFRNFVKTVFRLDTFPPGTRFYMLEGQQLRIELPNLWYIQDRPHDDYDPYKRYVYGLNEGDLLKEGFSKEMNDMLYNVMYTMDEPNPAYLNNRVPYSNLLNDNHFTYYQYRDDFIMNNETVLETKTKKLTKEKHYFYKDDGKYIPFIIYNFQIDSVPTSHHDPNTNKWIKTTYKYYVTVSSDVNYINRDSPKILVFEIKRMDSLNINFPWDRRTDGAYDNNLRGMIEDIKYIGNQIDYKEVVDNIFLVPTNSITIGEVRKHYNLKREDFPTVAFTPDPIHHVVNTNNNPNMYAYPDEIMKVPENQTDNDFIFNNSKIRQMKDFVLMSELRPSVLPTVPIPQVEQPQRQEQQVQRQVQQRQVQPVQRMDEENGDIIRLPLQQTERRMKRSERRNEMAPHREQTTSQRISNTNFVHSPITITFPVSTRTTLSVMQPVLENPSERNFVYVAKEVIFEKVPKDCPRYYAMTGQQPRTDVRVIQRNPQIMYNPNMQRPNGRGGQY